MQLWNRIQWEYVNHKHNSITSISGARCGQGEWERLCAGVGAYREWFKLMLGIDIIVCPR